MTLPKDTARSVLASLGVLDAVRHARRRIWALTTPEIRRREREARRAFPNFRARYDSTLACHLAPADPTRRALVVASYCPTPEAELVVVKTLQLAGFRVTVLVEDAWQARRPYFELAGVDDVRLWSDFAVFGSRFRQAAAGLVDEPSSVAELASLLHSGVHVGRFAVSTALRRHRIGSLDLADASHRCVATEALAESLSAVEQAARIVSAVRPDLTVFWDMEYSPKGELFDACIDDGIQVVAYASSHRTNGLMFKRYSCRNRVHQVASLSDRSWALMRDLEWNSSRKAAIAREIESTYASGDWYRECWTQARAVSASGHDIRARLSLDPEKPTAAIFPHIVYDAPLAWSTPLFPTYEDWFIETVRTACRNDRVNWLIKIHPANIAKRARKEQGTAEERALTRRIGRLPSHVRVLPAETPISTLSLLEVVDCCLTVRGTVGIEAARLGIPVLTGGTSRYSGRGFSVDSASVEEYLNRVARVEAIPRLSPGQQELADRFAYGLFAARPLVMRSTTWDYGRVGDPARGAIHVRTESDWRSATDIGELADWLGRSDDEDFLAAAMVNSRTDAEPSTVGAP